jgi:hypothetical protein
MILRLIPTLLLGLLTFIFALAPAVLAEEFNPAENCTGAAASSAYCQNLGSDTDPITGEEGVLKKVIDLLIVAAGVISVIMVIVGGLRFVLSNGEPEKATSGRKTVIYALVGLVIVIISQLIVSFALTSV